MNYIPTVSVLVNDRPIKFYSHEGRTFVEAKEGQPYKIRVTNNGPNRILVIASIDGINCITGEKAGPSDQGYVLAGYSSYSIQGFRTSNEQVAPFKFSKKEQSYAKQNAENNFDTSNCGVIGIRFVSEYVAPVAVPNVLPFTPLWNGYNGPNFVYTANTSALGAMNLGPVCRSYNDVTEDCASFECSVGASTDKLACFDMGTAFSNDSVNDRVHDTEFKEGTCFHTFEIFYASRSGLTAMGVKLDKEPQINLPNPWPGRKFCSPPK